MPDDCHSMDRLSADIAIPEKLGTTGTHAAGAAANARPRDPLWPVWISPLVAGAYYLALKGAFAHSIGAVVFDANDVNINDAAAPQWGSHWIYRTFAETVSLAFGTFIAAGIARQRAKLAAQIGGLSISAVYALINTAWFYAVYIARSHVSIEPWYEHLVEAAIILGAPFLGSAVSGLALELNGPGTVGFAGINRLHFVWLWIAAGMYGAGIVAPVTLWLSSQLLDDFAENKLIMMLHMIILGVPVLGFAYPAFGGLLVLSATGMSRVVRNTLGPAILVVGWIVATFIQFYWTKLVGWAFG